MLNSEIPIIQSLWIGDALSALEQLCILSFIKNGHEFHLYTYGKVKDVPKGTIVKDANEIIPEKDIFTYYDGSYAGFADWFRWALLYEKGNFWVDMDIVCIKPFIFDSDIVFGMEENDQVAAGVLGFPKGHKLTKFLKSICEQPNMILPYDGYRRKIKKTIRKIINNKRQNIGWGEAGGPWGMTKAMQHFNMLEKAKPFTYFYPISVLCWKAVFDETLAKDSKLFTDTYAIHLWNELLRKEGWDKNASFSKKSLIEQLKEKYF